MSGYVEPLETYNFDLSQVHHIVVLLGNPHISSIHHCSTLKPILWSWWLSGIVSTLITGWIRFTNGDSHISESRSCNYLAMCII